MASSGEQKAWETLEGLNPSVVCKNAAVSLDERSEFYILRSFCTDFSVNPQDKVIKNLAPEGEVFLKRYGHFFILSCLRYLIDTKNIPLTGRFIKPVEIKGGDMFLRGSHVLPLDGIARKYGNGKEAFIERGQEFCGEKLDYGDASIKLFPLPRIPVVLILWVGDDEFPPRADLLLDSTCQFQAPLDIIWSISMFTALLFL